MVRAHVIALSLSQYIYWWKHDFVSQQFAQVRLLYLQALIIAFTTNFIDRLVYIKDYSSDGTLRGFVNNSLSYFAVAELENGTQPLDPAPYNNVVICR